MGVRSFFSSAAKMLKLAKKPGRDEVWLSVKICVLGVAAIGAIGFLVKFISATLQAWSGV